MKAPRRPTRPFSLPQGAKPLGLSLEPSSGQMGAQSRAANQLALGMGDQASSLESLASIFPTTNKPRLLGPAMQGLKRASSI